MQRVDVGGRAICIAHSDDGRFYAVSDLCTHEEVSLSDGWVSGCEIECPRHNSIFSLTTGEALSLPAEFPLTVYAITIDGDDILIDLD